MHVRLTPPHTKTHAHAHTNTHRLCQRYTICRAHGSTRQAPCKSTVSESTHVSTREGGVLCTWKRVREASCRDFVFLFFLSTGYGVFIKDRAEVSVFDSEVICVVCVCSLCVCVFVCVWGGGMGRQGRKRETTKSKSVTQSLTPSPLSRTDAISLAPPLSLARARGRSLSA